MKDIDPNETSEWLAALANVVSYQGSERAQYLLTQLSSQLQIEPLSTINNAINNSAYCNSIPRKAQSDYPGDLALEQRIQSLIRWNAIAMVLRAGRRDADLGGHLGTYASASTLYEVGFNHVWQAGDLIFYQGHASPGIYARSYLEHRFDENMLDNFRQEASGRDIGLSSYPHPWLMPQYWQFPTVSMGLGPLQAIYQARFAKYLQARKLAGGDKKVWCFCGDGEMDEPESLGALGVAAREGLDNLIFVINCNLQRLDGPVRGNGKIVQELEKVFLGFGWQVIKVLWGSDWDPIFAQDRDNLIINRLGEIVDGEYQNFVTQGGAYLRAQLTANNSKIAELLASYSDDELGKLTRGGHDSAKVWSAYMAAVQSKQPCVILVNTIKGYGLGSAGEGLNTAHNSKKMNAEQLQELRERFALPLSDEQLQAASFYRPDKNSQEYQYLIERRHARGGSIPKRLQTSSVSLTVPTIDNIAFSQALTGSQGREQSTTMAFVRILSQLTKDKGIGARIVPIVPDESRTFGMEGLFRQLGIYAAKGQLYTPVDSKQVMFYKETKDGQILQEGINEPGAFASWMAAATSYSCHDSPCIPFYIYYSMFGFQRVGDLAWAAGDLRARGFLIGATAGRTTLSGEGLQHDDGHNLLMANLIPNCISYDPSFAYELAVIIAEGLKQMIEQQQDCFYYITAMNENYVQPPMPDNINQQDIIKGMYPLPHSWLAKVKKVETEVQLLGSGSILQEVIAAANLLAEFNVKASVWSATSFNLLARDAIEWQRQIRLQNTKVSCYFQECLANTIGPIIAATDYVKAYAEQVRLAVPAGRQYIVLGTDGFGRSDTRQNLRAYFEVDRYWIAQAALHALAVEGKVAQKVVMQAMQTWQLSQDKLSPQQH